MVVMTRRPSTTTEALSVTEVPALVERAKKMSRQNTRRLGVLAVVVAVSSVLPADIAMGKAELEDSRPIIHFIEEAQDKVDNDKMTVFIGGFADKDGSWNARNMSEAIQTLSPGTLAALEYADDIGLKTIAHEIAIEAERRHVTYVSLYGYSLGGMASLKIANILRDTYGIKVVTIFLDQMPASETMILPAQLDKARAFMAVIAVANDWGLDVQYSRIIRAGGEKLIGGDLSHLNNVPTSFMYSQLTMAASANTKKAIGALGENDDLVRPFIEYVTSEHPGDNTYINLVDSSDTLRESAEAAGIPYDEIVVSNLIHTRPDFTLPEYQAAFDQAAPLLALKREQMNDEFLFASGATIHTYIKHF